MGPERRPRWPMAEWRRPTPRRFGFHPETIEGVEAGWPRTWRCQGNALGPIPAIKAFTSNLSLALRHASARQMSVSSLRHAHSDHRRPDAVSKHSAGNQPTARTLASMVSWYVGSTKLAYGRRYPFWAPT